MSKYPRNQQFLRRALLATNEQQPSHRMFTFLNEISKHVDFNEIHVCYDLGSRDGTQAIELARIFERGHVYAFEPSPFNYQALTMTIDESPWGYRVTPLEVLASITDGTSAFFHSWGNPGASSGLDFKEVPFPQYIAPDKEKIRKLSVRSARLDTMIREEEIKAPDLLWVDVQGMEYVAFNGLGDHLKNVKAIHTEVGIQEYYHGHTLKPEIMILGHGAGFKLLSTNQEWDKEQELILVKQDAD